MTKQKKVKGMAATMKPFQIAKATIYVHYTSDERGKTLSLSYGNIQLTVPFKEIEDMIEEGTDE